MSKSSKVLNLKDQISGNEADLSLSDLTEVPVKELVGSPPSCLCVSNMLHQTKTTCYY